MHALLQTVGSAEVQSGWSGFYLALSTVALGLLTALGAYGADYVRGKRAVTTKDLELKSKELELRQLEVEEKIRQLRKTAAVDAAAIVEETARHQPALSGAVKQSLATEKLLELDPASKSLEGSALTDLVKLGVAQLRQSGTTFHMITPSMAPPPEQVTLPRKLPPPAAVPAIETATKTQPERPGAKR